MARIKLGAFVTDIRGSIGGTTFQAGKFGYIAKNFPLQPTPKNDKQNATKQRLTETSQFWQTMDQSVRDAYNAYAFAYPQYPKSGSTIQLTGYQVWMKYNAFLQALGAPFLTAPSYAPISSPTFTTVIFASLVSMTVTLTPGTTLDNNNFAIWLSQPMNNSSSPSAAHYRLMGQLGNTGGVLDVTSAYLSAFGVLPYAPNRVYIKIVTYGGISPNFLAPQHQSFIPTHP